MAAKRALYQPASSTSFVDKTTRKKTLQQGRLVTDTGLFSFPNQGCDDPTILPANSLPVLTEGITSRPEPLQCLDLSDSDEDILQPCDLSRPKPVLVLDASMQKDLPHGTELEVVVRYEDSPARVVCHTPGKLERSFREERRVQRDLIYSGGDGPSWAVKVDRVQNTSDIGMVSDKSSLLSGDGGLKRIKESRNRSSSDTSGYDPHHNRGIIEEILAQDLGSSNLEAISLQSETTNLSSQFLTNSIPEKHKHLSDNKRSEGVSSLSSKSTNLEVGSSVLSRSTQPKQKTIKVKNKTSFPQPNFEDDSDTSPDHVPVKETPSNQQTRVCDEYSESDVCSLYEYMQSSKSQDKQPINNKVATTLSKNTQEIEKLEASQQTKKKVQKSRKVASRYLQSSVNKATVLPTKNSNTDQSLSRPGLRAQPSAPTSSKQSRERIHLATNLGVVPKKPVPMKPSKSAAVLQVKASNSQAHPTVIIPTQQSFVRSDSPQDALRSSESCSKDKKTSTPTHDQVCNLFQDIDASSIQSVSTMSMNMSCAGIPRQWPSTSILENVNSDLKKPAPDKLSNKRNDILSTGRVAGSKSQRKSQMQFELEYSRFLQMAFLNCKAKKAYEQQDKTAQAQVHELWKLVEREREKNTQLKMDVSRLDGLIRQDKLLDTMEDVLDTMMPVVPELEAAYSRLSSELDTTRHQLPTRDVYVPAADREVYEDQLKAALIESRKLLVELDELTSPKIPPLDQYLTSAEAINSKVSSMYQALHNSQNDVATIQGLTTRLTSLYVQDL